MRLPLRRHSEDVRRRLQGPRGRQLQLAARPELQSAGTEAWTGKKSIAHRYLVDETIDKYHLDTVNVIKCNMNKIKSSRNSRFEIFYSNKEDNCLPSECLNLASSNFNFQKP